MATHMGMCPYKIRRYDQGMVAASRGIGSGAGSSGDVIVFFGANMRVTVFIHESAHSLDRGSSASNAWHQAVSKDSCVPDVYADTSYAECFAQVAVIWTYLVGTGRSKNFGGSQFVCMKHQLEFMAKILPAHELFN
ncbi:unnamed protein product [Rotaria sp. Silwood2]|nr:unnamed protein product [Rotaria sp. Silwood2]CAF2752937.1 unnamed protein product [Rotaria sp. Silwood2]CAF3256074.1 unnamed protein product [Rotaria sp. Silwood2]CAF3524784.1 unnamed protein product [Rotaria sp. Silwood2]CAF4059328.1 unnamed protein product [Rotaria sp. Silwood2]